MTAPVSTAAATAAYHGQPWSVSRMARTAAQTPLAYPADRSISPRSRTKTSPMAMAMLPALCVSRLAKFRSDRKTGRRRAKKTHRTTRPATAGREPSSPARTCSR